MKLQTWLRNLWFWFALGIFISIFLQGMNSPLYFLFLILQNIILIYVCIYISIYIHEFGHAIAGWLVGFPIKKITIGLGKNLWKYKIKATSTSIVINYGFQGGLTYIGDVSPNFLRFRFFIFASGGILSQILVVWLCTIIIFNGLDLHPVFDRLYDFFVFSNIFMIIANLLPYNTQAFGIPRPTDGLVLLTVFFMKEEQITEMLIAGQILDGLESIEAKEFEKAEQIFRECIIKSPNVLLPKINLSVVLIRQQRIDEAIALMIEILELKEAKEIRLALIYNNLAWCYLLKSITNKSILEKAEEYSNQAISINNKVPNFLGTRSCILIEMGKLTEAIKILKPMVKINQPVNETTNSVIGFLYLAYAYYQQEDLQKSSQYWQKIKDNQELQSSEYTLLFQHILDQTNSFEKL